MRWQDDGFDDLGICVIVFLLALAALLLLLLIYALP
jgi:hypothetical protein